MTSLTQGRKRAVLREREAQLSQAKENLARLSDGVELGGADWRTTNWNGRSKC